MKAAIINKFGGPEVFEIVEDVAQPVITDNDLLIKIRTASINPIDYKTRKGNLKMILGSDFPIILGYDACGEVIEMGKNVTKFAVGDVVFGRLDRKFGQAYAEYAVGSEQVFVKKPKFMRDEVAAAIPLAALTALQALRDKGSIKAGHRVLINGASGGVGQFAVQLVNHFGGICYAVCSSRHEEMMRELNPYKWIDYTKQDFKTLPQKFDIIFDIIGTESFLTCHNMLAKGGVYITSLPRLKVIAHKFLALFMPGKRVTTLLMKSISADLELVTSLVNDKKIKVYVDKVFPLEETAQAHTYAEEGHPAGKVIIRVSEGLPEELEKATF